jgi:hypothetical protein
MGFAGAFFWGMAEILHLIPPGPPLKGGGLELAIDYQSLPEISSDSSSVLLRVMWIRLMALR